MKREKKFRFIGDPHEYMGTELDKNGIYLGGHLFSDWDRDVEWHADSFPEDWEEVTEQEVDATYPGIEPDFGKPYKIPNQDQPASSMTKFEMAVFMAMQGMISRSDPNQGWTDGDSIQCIDIAKETFKQLENIKK